MIEPKGLDKIINRTNDKVRLIEYEQYQMDEKKKSDNRNRKIDY